jgi:hypothetical protein
MVLPSPSKKDSQAAINYSMSVAESILQSSRDLTMKPELMEKWYGLE